MIDLPLICRRLAGNLKIFETLVTGLSREETYWRPGQGKWSIVEVINHIADEESEDFRTRLDLALHAPETPWPPIDPEGWAVQRRYQERDLLASFTRFAGEREKSLAWLHSLVSPNFNSTCVHPQFGSVTAGSLFGSWLAHDYLHIRQVTRILYEYHRLQAEPHTVQYAGDW